MLRHRWCLSRAEPGALQPLQPLCQGGPHCFVGPPMRCKPRGCPDRGRLADRKPEAGMTGAHSLRQLLVLLLGTDTHDDYAPISSNTVGCVVATSSACIGWAPQKLRVSSRALSSLFCFQYYSWKSTSPLSWLMCNVSKLSSRGTARALLAFPTS